MSQPSSGSRGWEKRAAAALSSRSQAQLERELVHSEARRIMAEEQMNRMHKHLAQVCFWVGGVGGWGVGGGQVQGLV